VAFAVAAGAAALVRQYLEEGFHVCGVQDMARPPLSSRHGCRRFRRENLRETGSRERAAALNRWVLLGTRRGLASTRPRRW
jgi:hypothetical protein